MDIEELVGKKVSVIGVEKNRYNRAEKLVLDVDGEVVRVRPELFGVCLVLNKEG